MDLGGLKDLESLLAERREVSFKAISFFSFIFFTPFYLPPVHSIERYSGVSSCQNQPQSALKSVSYVSSLLCSPHGLTT